MNFAVKRHTETVDIHYLDPSGANFSFITHVSIPIAERPLDAPPEIAFSADGSKFAIAMDRGVSVWDIRSKVPLWTFMEAPWPQTFNQPQRHLQFISGNLGKEILVFAQVRIMFTF